jgi:hypothetical protein
MCVNKYKKETLGNFFLSNIIPQRSTLLLIYSYFLNPRARGPWLLSDLGTLRVMTLIAQAAAGAPGLRGTHTWERGPRSPPAQARTFGLRDVDQPAEDLAHARLQGEVFGAAGHGNDQVGRFQVPVLGQQLVEGFRVRVARQTDVLWGKGGSIRTVRS